MRRLAILLVFSGGCGGNEDMTTPASDGTTVDGPSDDDDDDTPGDDDDDDDTTGDDDDDDDTTGDDDDDDTTTGDDDDDDDDDTPPGAAPLEGYGTESTFGEGGEVCTVTTLEDSGPGSLRDCIENRDTTDDNPTPRRIEFEIGGTIMAQADIRIRQPFLTVDGLTAPDPGITIEKSGDGTDGEVIINTWSGNDTCGHDVLVQGIRFRGVWPRDTEEHSQNAGTIGIDGEDFPQCLHHVVLNRITVIDAQDAGGDIWGSATDVTVQYSAFLYSLHPNTYSHFPGGVPDQQRERLSNHHNLYAYIHERGPQVRGDNRDMNFEQNIMHRWAAFGFGGGYAMRLRCRDGACPQRLNVTHNHFTGGGANPEAALIVGEVAGDDADEATIDPEVYMADNWLGENLDSTSAPAPFDRPPHAEVTLVPADELVDAVLPTIGVPYRTDEESNVFDEVAEQITADLQ